MGGASKIREKINGNKLSETERQRYRDREMERQAAK